YDDETEKKIQSAIDKFFSGVEVLPSPASLIRTERNERCKSNECAPSLEDDLSKSLKCDVQCQTMITFPKDVDLVRLLGGSAMFLYDEDDDEVEDEEDCSSNEDSNLSTSSLRRKLFGISEASMPCAIKCSKSSSGILKHQLENLNMCADETYDMEDSVHLVSSPAKDEGSEFSRRSTWCAADTFGHANISPIRVVEEEDDDATAATNVSMLSFDKVENTDERNFDTAASAAGVSQRCINGYVMMNDDMHVQLSPVTAESKRVPPSGGDGITYVRTNDGDSSMAAVDDSPRRASRVFGNLVDSSNDAGKPLTSFGAFSNLAHGGTFSATDSGIGVSQITNSMNFTDASKFCEMSRLKDINFSSGWKIPLKASTPHPASDGQCFNLEH
ncbi:unnamed protein product, partial [Soboliphyme baturini]|uniref:Protein aurora borealis n=1 Tax=Soboliphyme baturini TaxID=241478 RepID=A0A183II62_9BILA